MGSGALSPPPITQGKYTRSNINYQCMFSTQHLPSNWIFFSSCIWFVSFFLCLFVVVSLLLWRNKRSYIYVNCGYSIKDTIFNWLLCHSFSTTVIIFSWRASKINTFPKMSTLLTTTCWIYALIYMQLLQLITCGNAIKKLIAWQLYASHLQ